MKVINGSRTAPISQFHFIDVFLASGSVFVLDICAVRAAVTITAHLFFCGSCQTVSCLIYFMIHDVGEFLYPSRLEVLSSFALIQSGHRKFFLNLPTVVHLKILFFVCVVQNVYYAPDAD